MERENNFGSKRIFLVDKESVSNLSFIKNFNVNTSDEIILFLGKNSQPIKNEDIYNIFSKNLRIKIETIDEGEGTVLALKLMCMLMDSNNFGPIDFYVVSNSDQCFAALKYIERTFRIKIGKIYEENNSYLSLPKEEVINNNFSFENIDENII